uniref:LLGL scribble cell polarity complex component 2 n=1 Tax=Sinocyclocheilus grahami TaxID=75366 RepID=A0A672M8L8_SINGR
GTMKRFRRHGHESQRDKHKQDLYQFNKTVEHGFPHQPSALGFSPSLELLAIGTRSGAIKLYGTPGVEFMGLHDENAAVTQVHFLPNQVGMVTLLDDNSLHMWTLRLLFVIADLFTATFPRIPEDYVGRRNLECVEALHENPLNPRQVLIGYSRGLMVLWDLDRQRPIQHFLCTQQLESVWWMEDGVNILSSHSDGSYCQWTVTGEDPQTEPEKQETPYGAFPCKAISKIIQLPSKQGPPFLIFSGGMPRASYGDRHCISVIHSKFHEALDFTSRIIDYFVIREPSALVVLVEEELVVVDLQSEGWPVIQTPYLVPLHCSAITCSHHVSSIPLKLWERVQAAGAQQTTHYSRKPWPIIGGQNLSPDPPQRDLLLTGHEDGTVRFWDASGVCLYPMYKLSTAGVFLTDADPNDNMNQGSEGEWPPFRKVGCFDPYSDDPRLGIQKIHLCKYSGYLTVAGTAGQILILELNDEGAEQMVEATVVDLLQGQEGFRWKGQARLDVREEPVLFPPGFQPFALVQCQPPAVITAIALHSEWKLVAFGTSHGFGFYDYHQKNNIMVKCTLSPSDQVAMEGPLSRVKSIKKSLRQSFRRIRRSRVSMRKHHTTNALPEINARLEAEALHEMELAPVQRKIEARSSDDSFTGLVRTLYFADTFVSDSSHSTPSLWAGTNGGAVFAYVLRVPSLERRAEDPVVAHAAKEIQLMHRAPVVGLVVLDGKGTPLPEPLEVAHDLARSPEMHGSHHLLVVSEEQFKLFTLPKVSSKSKLKLTAVDGSRVRRVGVAWFGSRTDEQLESSLVVLTNQGELHVISLPSIKMMVRYPCIRKDDVSGIASCVFTKYGQGFYLMSPSEFERFSLSTRWVVEPRCLVEAPLQMRPKNPSSPVHRDQPDGVPTEHRLAYDLNTTASTTTEPRESLALERQTSHSRACTPRERSARDHHLCLLRPNTVSPPNPLHADQPLFTPPASVRFTAAT